MSWCVIAAGQAPFPILRQATEQRVARVDVGGREGGQ